MLHATDVISRGAGISSAGIDLGWLGRAGGQHPLLALLALAAIAVIALVVAGAAYSNDTRRRRQRAEDDSDLFTTTPLPMSKEELARATVVPSRHAFGEFRLPRWVQVGSLLVAFGMTWVVSQRLTRDNGASADSARASDLRSGADRDRAEADTSPEDLDLSLADSVAPFSFRVREWTPASSGCAGRLEVTRGAPAPWVLVARVHDERGQLIDTARARVASLRAGDVVEFHFARASCDQIGAWDVRGDRRDP